MAEDLVIHHRLHLLQEPQASTLWQVPIDLCSYNIPNGFRG